MLFINSPLAKEVKAERMFQIPKQQKARSLIAAPHLFFLKMEISRLLITF